MCLKCGGGNHLVLFCFCFKNKKIKKIKKNCMLSRWLFCYNCEYSPYSLSKDLWCDVIDFFSCILSLYV